MDLRVAVCEDPMVDTSEKRQSHQGKFALSSLKHDEAKCQPLMCVVCLM